jgi:amphi-Trp domain-containing protein
MSRNDYEGELTADREEIASVLNGVADGVRTGAVRLGDGADAVTVDTPDELTLEIELETEDGETSLELELEWSVSSDASPVSSASEREDEAVTLAGAADASQSLARFEVYQARDEEWRWRLRHRNGNIIATSGEGYTRKHNALKGLRTVMTNSANAAVTGEFTD